MDHFFSVGWISFSALRLGLSLPDIEELKQLDREAVNTFHAISHHLPPDRRQDLEAKRRGFEQKLMQELELQQPIITFANAKEMRTYAEAVLQAVEDCLQALLDNTSTHSANRLW